MKRLTVRSCGIAATSALVLATALRLSAQTTAPAAASTEDSETTVVLSPFVIEASEDSGYSAKDTLAGTRIRTELKDVASSIQIVTQKFLSDTNSKRADDLLPLTTGTEVAAQGGNFLGQGDGPFVTGTAARPVSNTRVRGLAEADNTRDFFLSDIPWDSYNVGRVDLQRGPNSVLFGIGSPAGIVNSSLNGANTNRNTHKVEFQFGSFGSWRASADFNRVLLKNVLAIRVALLDDETKYRQDPAFRDDKRLFAALKWNPEFLNKNGAHGSFRINGENGKIDSNLPRYTPPIDTITPWFTGMNKATYDARVLNNGVPTAFIGPIGNRVYDGFATRFDASGAQGTTIPTSNKQTTGLTAASNVNGVNNNAIKGIATTDLFAKQANLPGAASGLWKAASLTDRGIFDYYNNLFEGPNKSEFNKFKAMNAAYSQTFLNDKLGFELAYDWQNARWGNDTVMAEDGTTVTIDINTTLIDGSSNSAYVGRPMVVLGGGSASVYREERTRKTTRLTGFAELNFADISGKDSTLAKIFGRNTFTTLFTEQRTDGQNQQGPRWYTPKSFAANSGSDSVVQASRDVIKLVYVGGSLSGASNASGLGFQGLKTKITPGQSNVIGVWRDSPGAFQNFTLNEYDSDKYADADKTYSKGYKYNDIVQSTAVVWQGYWFGGNVIPMMGYRRDTNKNSSAAATKAATNGESGAVAVTDDSFKMSAPSRNSGNSVTRSLVTHLPKGIRSKLPGNMDISLFAGSSENFKPETRRDIRGAALDNPKGKTKEYGITITGLDDKLSFKAVHFDTKVKNATINGALAGFYLIGANEWWGGNAARAQRDANSWQAGNYGTATNGKVVTWQPDATTVSSGTPIFQSDGVTYTQAALDQTRAAVDAAVNDWFAKLAPADVQAAWEFVSTVDGAGNKDGNYSPSAMALTATTHSKGWEFELVANPVKGLDISFNASKTSAQRSDLAGGYTDWILKRWKDLQGPMGDIRIWGGSSGGETTRSKFQNETYAGYLLFNAIQGTDVPELHKWRYNLTSNYTFQNESLKGVNAGFSYRWSDASVVGFLSKPSIDTISGRSIDVADLTKPVKGKSEGIFDFWVGYERKLNAHLKWRIQANVRNAFADNKLIPTTIQPNGVIATFRIPEPRTYSITNTLEF